jgi:hypothetical protein
LNESGRRKSTAISPTPKGTQLPENRDSICGPVGVRETTIVGLLLERRSRKGIQVIDLQVNSRFLCLSLQKINLILKEKFVFLCVKTKVYIFCLCYQNQHTVLDLWRFVESFSTGCWVQEEEKWCVSAILRIYKRDEKSKYFNHQPDHLLWRKIDRFTNFYI